jgi:hypothetical protein
MVDILHRVGITSPADVYAALTTTEGLAGWWTTNTRGEGNDVGGVLQIPLRGGRIRHEGPGASPRQARAVGGSRRTRRMDRHTHVDWSLEQTDDYTIVLFQHTI